MRSAASELAIRRALAAGVLNATEIAAHLGCARETVSRIRARMRREVATQASAREWESAP